MINISKSHNNIAVLTGYELELSAALKKGSDIWLNTPRRPQEASGTSGMTAAMNGSVNLSINDGWIPEFAVDGENAFIIPEADLNAPLAHQDGHDHFHIMRILEDIVVPTYYYHRDKWHNIVKRSMRDVSPQFDSDRMAKEYYDKMF